MDGIDAVLCKNDSGSFVTLQAVSTAFEADLLPILHQLCSPGENELHLSRQAGIRLSFAYANAVEQLLFETKISPSDITAIGVHGQTVRHMPIGCDKSLPYTVQLVCPATLAVATQIDVVSDFRTKDMVLGGQGAPLVPAFHHAVFAHESATRCVINIGGISNFTALAPQSVPYGYDTGPGNTILDQWTKTHLGIAYDDKGQWAASGQVNQDLLSRLIADDYFTQAPPKSTGREHFNLTWLQQHLAASPAIPAADVQATLVELTAISIANEVSKDADDKEYYVCGGGVYNDTLMTRLAFHLKQSTMATTDQLNVHPMHVEAAAFAWLAYAFTNRLHGNVREVTGANKHCVLGSFTPFA